jgi:hypothetical protein
MPTASPGRGDGVDGEAGRPDGHLGWDRAAVGGDRARRVDAGDVGVLVHADAEPVERRAQVALGW